MRPIASSALVVAALCIGGPASAGFSTSAGHRSVPRPTVPSYVYVPSGPAIDWDAGEARKRIRDARKAGVITRGEARQLRREAAVIARHAEHYSRDGLSDSERRELETRTLYLIGSVPVGDPERR